MSKLCKNVQKLTSDEKAIYLKLVDRTASRFLCLDCLGEKWDVGAPLKKNPLLSGKRQLCIIPLKQFPLHTNQEEKLLFYFVKS
ncbi:MAG: hypothetical protein ACLSD6_02930 [Clostridium sp.]